jgi:hypothetical protein
MLNPELSGKPFFLKNLEKAPGQPLLIGWIGEGQIEVFEPWPIKVCHGIAGNDPTTPIGPQGLDVLSEGPKSPPGPFDKYDE